MGFFFILLYRILFLPALLLASFAYVRRMFKRGGYGKNFSQRFGATPKLPVKNPALPRIWLQAVSVGEILAVGPLIRRISESKTAEIYLTTTTSTGYALACEKYGSLTVAIGYFPLDFWLFSWRAWSRINPDLVLLAEGETWIEHLRQARLRKVPAVLINARLSDRSFARLNKFRSLAAQHFSQLAAILVSSEHDAQRFLALGLAREKISVTGNLKFDVTLPALDTWERAMLRRELGFVQQGEIVILGSSTWPGEEEAMLRLFERVRRDGIVCHLLLVPRHAERRSEIESLLKDRALTWHLRSQGNAIGLVDVCIADTTGELARLTQVADLVFIGKSLAPNSGGQTPIEAAALGKAILFGPEMTNFRHAADSLVQCGAAHVVSDGVDLVDDGLALLRDEKRREIMAAAAARWHIANQGATDRTLKTVGEFCAKRTASKN